MAGSLAQRLDRSLARLGGVALVPLLILAVPWTQEIIDQVVFGGRWNLPMVPGGPFLGVLTAPFSHSGFGHLIGNSLWFLPLSWLVLAKSRGDYLAVWLGVYATAILVWLFWHQASHGLSGVIYGLLGLSAADRLAGASSHLDPSLAHGPVRLRRRPAQSAAVPEPPGRELDRPRVRFRRRPAGGPGDLPREELIPAHASAASQDQVMAPGTAASPVTGIRPPLAGSRGCWPWPSPSC